MRTIILHLYVLTVGLVVAGCSGSDVTSNPTVGGSNSVGGSPQTGGSSNASSGGTSATAQGGGGIGGSQTGGMLGTGGNVVSTGGNPATNTGGMPGTGGARTGGAPGTGGAVTGGNPATGGAAAGGAATGGRAATGGSAATGGKAATGGSAATGGKAATGGSNAVGGAATGGATGAVAGGSSVDCSTPMPTGGTVHQYAGSGTNVNGTADGLNYGIWSNGSGGSITVFPNAHAFSASWNNGGDFLAHLGLNFNASKSYTAYGTIAAQFVETKTGSGGGYSNIGMYGWTHSPCVEWYINEDSFNALGGTGTATATIDGGTYNLRTLTTTGTGGANACESGHTGNWTQMISTRKTARQCGTITVSDHFKAWAAQGWSLGTLASVHINVETGGGTGSIQFPVATVTAN